MSRPHNGSATAAEFPWDQVQQLDYQDANTGSIAQACHAMIFAKTEAKFVSQLPCKAWVLMQMRFDGKLGFPGGVVSDQAIPDTTLEDGLNREMEEELALDMSRFAFSKKHYVVSHFCPKANLILNFYAQEVTEQEFKEIEGNALRAEEYGHECLGIVRIPLFTLQDGHNGLPVFLQNQFAGTSILQVIVGLCTHNLMKPDELNTAMAVLPRHQGYRRLVHQAVASFRDRQQTIRVPDLPENRAVAHK
ncbi:putative U8 snoRNA-decapping enzyme [Hypsibius exemplaris]|uniref:U8 snoRNA-decapping enzyme n=1 Tax=Hypsibius exemplaris TaxID=2072580 RepID=A0A1W0XC51_HYPEX|nr:putative U8 snoRNA-decapping enzyme [Hypsibius exemplaris]